MRPSSSSASFSSFVPDRTATGSVKRSEWAALKTLVPYLWEFKGRVLLALAFLIAAKFGNVGVPLVLKQIVDHLSIRPTDPAAVLVLPVALLVGYGLLRLCTNVAAFSSSSFSR